jgi:2'-5' RNA ligase
MARQRLFVGLYPDAETRQLLSRLARQYTSGRLVKADNIHLTLAFLGMLDDEQAACAGEVVSSSVGEVSDLCIDMLGSFRRARVLWAGCTDVPQALQTLQQELSQQLVRCGYQPEHRGWQPHITLRRKFTKALVQCQPVDPIPWRVDKLVLFRSDSTPDGVCYTPLVEKDLYE